LRQAPSEKERAVEAPRRLCIDPPVSGCCRPPEPNPVFLYAALQNPGHLESTDSEARLAVLPAFSEICKGHWDLRWINWGPLSERPYVSPVFAYLLVWAALSSALMIWVSTRQWWPESPFLRLIFRNRNHGCSDSRRVRNSLGMEPNSLTHCQRSGKRTDRMVRAGRWNSTVLFGQKSHHDHGTRPNSQSNGNPWNSPVLWCGHPARMLDERGSLRFSVGLRIPRAIWHLPTPSRPRGWINPPHAASSGFLSRCPRASYHSA
jgi:hypothetical protein